MTLPVALSGTDVIGQAKTGTGKTLGFGLPLLERVTVPADVEAGRAKPESLTDAPQALVVVPTRELCTQVTNDLLTAGKVRNVRVLAIYGGRAYEPQVEALKKGVDVIVGTPGRLLDLAGQKKLNLKHIKALVLDEADEMLDLGFLPDVEKIINMLPARRQTMLFSATMPGAVIGLARRYMSQPTHIRATAPDDEGATVANIAQHVYRAHNMDKPEMVARILQADGRGLAMVFCRTKRTAADLADQLQQRGFASGAVHGDLGQGAREQALRAFRNGKVDVLVCTDVAARGIDVEGVTHVINYQSPEEEKTYLHRIGRTGRAGNTGTAITLVDWDDIPRWQLINKALELNFNDPPETYSTSPHLFEELSIPAGTKGVLPRSERTRAGLAAEKLEDLGETGGRGARGRGGRGGRDDSQASSDRERPARTPRRRRRTRGGSALDGTPAPAAGAGTPEETAEAVTAPRTPRRRRRTRAGATPEQAPAVTATSADPAEAAVATAEGPSLDTVEETPAKPRRRRTRKSAEPQATSADAGATPETEAAKVTEAVQASEAATAPQATEPEEAPAAKPRRRTRKAAATAETAVATAEGTTEAVQPAPEAAETKPKARRTRKATAATETAEAAPEAAEAAPKARRTRKVTAAAETAVDTAEAVEAKPKARRTRKTAATVETADIPAQTTQEPEAAEAAPKARRTRKATAAAEAAVDTAEAVEAKPRRTRKAAATAVDTAEAVEAKPRRTRKAAATVAEPEAAEAKPRRTRKAAATAESAVDTAEAIEAKPKARRTRKTAATADIPAQATQEPEATEAPAPRRRTRKAAATVEAADGAAEAKPKVRRTRKATAAAEPTEG
ncbi:Superfamily II DNA and RNA helicase [Streptomyces sp. cf386]|uniref:DEAD/DEAH box helicase n=1 Tax=Streptomyces sp. cf386 TaxID=1761904 RepID=UPI0008833B18|nr:DEAD/DEAH box helicase [Streptomyces sp. cf386]SDN72125.1 Superfamily II DNA and RNA helicase [Streptomyces sp. cf386]